MSERTGEYIVTEGTDATGKTTVANLMAERAYSEGHEVIRVDEPDSAYLFEPGTLNSEPLSPIASEIRRIIKDGSLGRTALTNVHLFTAARLENWQTIVRPALERGAWVFGARNFLSTVAYQGYAEGFDINKIMEITRKSMGPQYMNPDHLFILDLEDENERSRRIAERGDLEKPDTFESRGTDFQQRIIAGYRQIANDHGILLTSANRPKDEIADDLWNRVQRSIAFRNERYPDTGRAFSATWKFK